MKFIFKPLLALSLVLSVVSSQKQQQQQQQSFNAFSLLSKSSSDGDLPIGLVYAYWPNKKPEENSKIIEITGDDDQYSSKYVAVFKDPKENKLDMSTLESMNKFLTSNEYKSMEVNNAESWIDPKDIQSKILFSVYLDEDDNVVYSVPGTDIPTSWNDVRNFNTMVANAIMAKLDPNTPGFQDIKDPTAAMAQLILNDIAMQGPNALDDAKRNPALIETLDNAFEASQNWEDIVADLDERALEEEEQKRNGGAGANNQKKKIQKQKKNTTEPKGSKIDEQG